MKTILFYASLAGAALLACDTENSTQAIVDNGYSSPDGSTAPSNVVYRAWWVATYFPNPVSPEGSSEQERSIPSTGFAYAVVAPGWDPASSTAPTSLVVMKSKNVLAVDRGGLLHIKVADDTFAGSCAANQPLGQDDADFITQRIFPGDFSGFTYDAKTCTLTPASTDAGTDATSDASTDAPDGG